MIAIYLSDACPHLPHRASRVLHVALEDIHQMNDLRDGYWIQHAPLAVMAEDIPGNHPRETLDILAAFLAWLRTRTDLSKIVTRRLFRSLRNARRTYLRESAY